MKLTGEKKMNVSSRISPRTLAFLGVAALLLVLGAIMSVRSQASVAATAVSAPSSVNVAAEHDNAARLQRSNAAAAARSTAMGEAYAASDAARLERSNAAAAARYTAMAEYYAHGPLMLAKPAIGNGSVNSEIAPTGRSYAGRTAPSEKHVPGGGR